MECRILIKELRRPDVDSESGFSKYLSSFLDETTRVEYDISTDDEEIKCYVDVVMIDYNIAIECKLDMFTRNIQSAIGQCFFYSYFGYSPVIVVPYDPYTNHRDLKIKIVEKANIPFFELRDNPEELIELCSARQPSNNVTLKGATTRAYW